jgi:hypothetical protein
MSLSLLILRSLFLHSTFPARFTHVGNTYYLYCNFVRYLSSVFPPEARKNLEIWDNFRFLRTSAFCLLPPSPHVSSCPLLADPPPPSVQTSYMDGPKRFVSLALQLRAVWDDKMWIFKSHLIQFNLRITFEPNDIFWRQFFHNFWSIFISGYFEFGHWIMCISLK